MCPITRCLAADYDEEVEEFANDTSKTLFRSSQLRASEYDLYFISFNRAPIAVTLAKVVVIVPIAVLIATVAI